MSCPDLTQMVCGSSEFTPSNREGSDTPMNNARKRSSFHSSAGLVTLNVYATKVCLRFPSSPSPDPALFYASTAAAEAPATAAVATNTNPGSPPKTPEQKREYRNSEASPSSCELIDVSDYKCECEDRLDLDYNSDDSETVSCQDFTWYDSCFRVLTHVF